LQSAFFARWPIEAAFVPPARWRTFTFTTDSSASVGRPSITLPSSSSDGLKLLDGVAQLAGRQAGRDRVRDDVAAAAVQLETT